MGRARNRGRKSSKEDTVHVHSGVLLSCVKNEITPSTTTEIDLEMIIPGEVSQKKTNII